jgi:cytochrome c556
MSSGGSLSINSIHNSQEACMTRVQHNLCGCLAVLICLVFTSTIVQAQEDEAFIQYRQKVMTSISANMGAIGDILKNKLPYQSHIAVHAQEIQRMSTVIPEAFKKDIAAGKTDAKPEIWKEWDKFVAAANTMGLEAAELVKVAQNGNMEAIGAQVKKLSDTCGNCHKPYRKPKEESYKNKP